MEMITVSLNYIFIKPFPKLGLTNYLNNNKNSVKFHSCFNTLRNCEGKERQNSVKI